MNYKNIKISFNAPVILTFTLICFISLIIGYITNGFITEKLFSVYRSSISSPLTYIRLLGHVFGHTNYQHFIGNITLILITGTLLEDKYGSYNIAFIILITAITTGIINIILFPNIRLLGASGVAFAFILLSSITKVKDNKIPLTFIIVAIIYIGGQIYEGIFIKDNISNISHIIGGIIGAIFGYILNKRTR